VSMNPAAPGAAPRPINFRSIQPVGRDRLTAALRIIWVIPQLVVLTFVYIGASSQSSVGSEPCSPANFPNSPRVSSPVPFDGVFVSTATFTS
jgi:hypothetical protein